MNVPSPIVTASPAIAIMLAMLAAGMTWEEIWQVVGLTGQQP